MKIKIIFFSNCLRRDTKYIDFFFFCRTILLFVLGSIYKMKKIELSNFVHIKINIIIVVVVYYHNSNF